MSKPPKDKKSHYAWHACWHDDAWRGIELMPPDVVGVYWRIILLMYRRRSALPDDDATMAMACFTSVKQYRRAKAALLGAGRIEVDAESGLLYCTRAVTQLVKDERWREAQSQRGAHGGRGKKKSEPKPPPAVLVIDNVATFQKRDEGGLGADLEANLGGGNSVSNSTRFEGKQALSKTPRKATYTYTHKDSSNSEANTPNATAARSASPPLTGGEPRIEKKTKHKEALDALQALKSAKLSARDDESEEGSEGNGEAGPAAPGDRKAVRK